MQNYYGVTYTVRKWDLHRFKRGYVIQSAGRLEHLPYRMRHLARFGILGFIGKCHEIRTSSGARDGVAIVHPAMASHIVQQFLHAIGDRVTRIDVRAYDV